MVYVLLEFLWPILISSNAFPQIEAQVFIAFPESETQAFKWVRTFIETNGEVLISYNNYDLKTPAYN